VLLSTVVEAGPTQDLDPSIPVTERIVLTQIPEASPRAFADLHTGSRIVLFDPTDPAAGVTNLTPGFDAAGHPDLSFDGERVLFVGRQAAGDSLDVWEMGVDGSAPRRITNQPEDCTRAIYLSTLYTLNADAPERRIAYCVANDMDRPAGRGCRAIYTSRMDGSDPRRITFNPYGVGDPLLLTDGRLLYTGALPPEHGGGNALFTVNTDGTDVSAFAAVHEVPAFRGNPCETGDGRVVYVESALDDAPGGGALVGVRRTRSLHTRHTLAEEPGTYDSPSALPDGSLLVSYRSGDEGTFGLYQFGERNDPHLSTIFDSREWHEVDAIAVRPRKPPAGRSSVVDERVDSGYLYCLDSYRTDRIAAGTIEIDAGEIKTVRVRRTSTDTAGLPEGEVLGEAEVRADGSFYLQVPARTALRLETLDSAGELLQTMDSWIWVMPNERRGCIGCHENREMAPPNRHVLALRAQPDRIGVTGGHSTSGGHRK